MQEKDMPVIIEDRNVWEIVRRTLGCVDSRLIDHGERVAYIMFMILRQSGTQLSAMDLRTILILSLMHDIGAYKTEEIDRMLVFEGSEVWEHTIYGYQYLQKLSPLTDYAEAILYHHVDYHILMEQKVEGVNSRIAQLLHLADRVDMLWLQGSPIHPHLEQRRGSSFAPWAVDWFLEADKEGAVCAGLLDGQYAKEIEETVMNLHFDEWERRRYLEMLAYSIDFRSEFMVLHTVTTVSAGRAIAALMGMPPASQRKLYYGTLLHDIGKVATPVEILEKPGALTPEEYDIMKQHVTGTEKILDGLIDPAVFRIAVRHHEKLNGKGYPRGLTEEDLSIEERICAISDIMSALIRKRSYKAAFTREQTVSILRDMANAGEICSDVVEAVSCNYEKLMEEINRQGKNAMEIYQSIKTDYEQMLKQVKAGIFPRAKSQIPESKSARL